MSIKNVYSVIKMSQHKWRLTCDKAEGLRM